MTSRTKRGARRKTQPLMEYVRDIRAAMGLTHCGVMVMARPAGDEAAAEIGKIYGQAVYQLWVSADFTTYSPEDQRWAITHEFCHIPTFPTSRTVENAKKLLGQPAFSQLEKNHGDDVEEATDFFARLVAPFMPLPRGRIVIGPPACAIQSTPDIAVRVIKSRCHHAG